MKNKNITESKYNNYKIVNLTFSEGDTAATTEEGYSMICSHCETAMTLADRDITSPSDRSRILVNKYQYYCKKCGLIKDATADAATAAALRKRRENIGL